MVEKPEYVTKYKKPVNTEIKQIRGHWYLYERRNEYDPAIKRSRKKSGKCLGKITESGFVPSKAEQKRDLTGEGVCYTHTMLIHCNCVR